MLSIGKLGQGQEATRTMKQVIARAQVSSLSNYSVDAFCNSLLVFSGLGSQEQWKSQALRANVGMEGRFDNGLVLFAEGGPDMIRLSDEPLDSCAAGAGTVLDLGIRAGAQFRFDVTHSVR